MSTSVLNISLGSKIKIQGEIYDVVGYSELSEDKYSDDFKEYKLVGKHNEEVKWLCFDYESLKYSLHIECNNSEEFREENIIKIGYRKVYSGEAKVWEALGDAEVVVGESVKYVEYEDSLGQNIMTSEYWNSGLDYYKGFYLENCEIILLDSEDNKGKIEHKSAKITNASNSKVFISTSVIVTIIILGFVGGLIWKLKDKNILGKAIEKNPRFSYVTSTTSDLEPSLKANVFSTSMDIEGTVKALIDMVNGNVEDVMENTEDLTVIVLTKDELALVYSNEKGDTLIQISSREYVYTSGVNPYKASDNVSRYYRTYYHTRGYSMDKTRYKKRKSNYDIYKTEADINKGNSDNKYSNYGSSIRQSSTSSRGSSGGGTSSGK